MYIPDTVEYSTFYWAAKKKGVKVTSKYAGVYISETTNKTGTTYLRFKATGMIGGKVFQKNFPFNQKGELEAHKYYLRYQENNTEKRGRGVRKLKLDKTDFVSIKTAS